MGPGRSLQVPRQHVPGPGMEIGCGGFDCEAVALVEPLAVLVAFLSHHSHSSRPALVEICERSRDQCAPETIGAMILVDGDESNRTFAIRGDVARDIARGRAAFGSQDRKS